MNEAFQQNHKSPQSDVCQGLPQCMSLFFFMALLSLYIASACLLHGRVKDRDEQRLTGGFSCPKASCPQSDRTPTSTHGAGAAEGP